MELDEIMSSVDPFYDLHLLRRQLDVAIEMLDDRGDVVALLAEMRRQLDGMQTEFIHLTREIDTNFARLLTIFAENASPSQAYHAYHMEKSGRMPYTDQAWGALGAKDRLL